jgi:hypothetical protein
MARLARLGTPPSGEGESKRIILFIAEVWHVQDRGMGKLDHLPEPPAEATCADERGAEKGQSPHGPLSLHRQQCHPLSRQNLFVTPNLAET